MENIELLILSLLTALFFIVVSMGNDKRVENYKDYLKTNHWKKTRKKALIRAGYKCSLCGSKENLNVHHNSYKNLWKEKNSDLVVLCREHHKMVHNKK